MWAGRVVWEYRDPELAKARTVEAAAILALRSHASVERLAGVRDLERLHGGGSATSIHPLTALLGDTDPDVRAAAAEALGTIAPQTIRTGSDGQGIRAAVTALIRLLKDPQSGARIAAAHALEYITSAACEATVSPAAGLSAGGGKSVASLTAAPLTTPVDNTAVIAALALALRDPDTRVRRAAILALAGAGSIGDPPKALAMALEDESAENRMVAVRSVVGFGRGLSSWLPSLLRIAAHDQDRWVRSACLWELRQLQPSAITPTAMQVLIEGLRASDLQVRIAFAELLGRIGPDAAAAVPALLRVLTEPIDQRGPGFGNERGNLDWAAGFAVGQIAPKSVPTEQLIATLIDVARSGDRDRQGPAASALGEFGPAAAAAIPVLIRMVIEADPGDAGNRIAQRGVPASREDAAARALGLIAADTRAAPKVVRVLMAALQSDRARARAGAITALEAFGPKAAIAIPAIRALRNDPDAHVRLTAESALSSLED